MGQSWGKLHDLVHVAALCVTKSGVSVMLKKISFWLGASRLPKPLGLSRTSARPCSFQSECSHMRRLQVCGRLHKWAMTIRYPVVLHGRYMAVSRVGQAVKHAGSAKHHAAVQMAVWQGSTLPGPEKGHQIVHRTDCGQLTHLSPLIG